MVRSRCLLACCMLAALLLVIPTHAYPSGSNDYLREDIEPIELVDLMNRLRGLVQLERKMNLMEEGITSDKRNLDFGLNRGYSGSIHGKHLLGVNMASFAGGPGRRRRDVQQ